MESSASTAASSSTGPPPSAALPTGDYEVFLSFRGPDVRKRFADHLYTSLARAKIRTFRDEEELEKGEGIAPSLVRAIPESKIYIPILSEQYASSKWCLTELAQMVECWKQGKGHVILPIFYFVDPRDVRKQQGPYQQAFEQHATKHTPQTVKEWKEALLKVGTMKGWHVTESHGEGAVVDEVLSKVESHLRSMYTLVTDELVGIDTPVKEVMELLNLGSSTGKVIVGIHGMSGLGKTTLVQAVYNKICAQFDRCCFLDDAREALAKSNGVVSLQSKVISTVLKVDFRVRSVSEGINLIKDRVCKHKLLLVVDDIDDKFEFDRILGKLGDFSSSSRFIFTTRYSRALDFIPDCKLYEPREMSRHFSLQLFSKHAFRMDNPPEEDAGISEEFVKVATGLPLALKVIGSFLFRRERSFWEEKLMELQEIASTTENPLQKRLKISYNDLSPDEKQIFLDISCFFIGSYKDVLYYLWSDCGFYPESGITTLIDRSLMKFDEEDRFWMHDHIRDLGRAIVKEEDVEHPYKRSRIWSVEDTLDMLRKGEGSELVKVVRIDMGFGDDNDILLESKNFKKLSGLKCLDVAGISMKGDFSRVLPNICCLQLSSCRSIPTNVNTKKLVAFILEMCDVKDDWKGWSGIKAASKLKVLSLVHCQKLTKSPDLSTCTSLEHICFHSCLKMKGPVHISNFVNLKTLLLKYTSTTDIVPRGGGGIGKLQRLASIDVNSTQLGELPAEMETLSSLKILKLEQWKGWQTEIPRLPGSLKTLFIWSSSGVPNLLHLEQLESLNYGYGPLNLGDLWRLPNLKELTLEHFRNTSTVLLLQQERDQEATHHALPASLTSLEFFDCPDLNELPSLANLCNLTRLKLSGIGVAEIPGLGELRAMETLWIECRNLNNFDGLENLILLRTLNLRSSAKLERLPSLANLGKLEDLEVSDCPNLVDIQGLGGLGECLSRLTIRRCPRLTNFDVLQLLGALEALSLHELRFGGEQLPDLSKLVNLKELNFSYCRSLTNLVGVDRLESLRWVSLLRCDSIRKLPNLSGLKNLWSLELEGCIELTGVEGVEGLESLMVLRLRGCRSITELGDLSGLKKLQRLDVLGCTKLIEVNGLDELKELEEVKMETRMRVRCLAKSAAARYAMRLCVFLAKFALRITLELVLPVE